MGIFTGIDFMPFNAFERSALKATAPFRVVSSLAFFHSASEHRLVLQLGLEVVERFTEISNLRNSRKPLILSGFSAVFVLVDFTILSVFLTVTSAKSQPSS